MSVTTEVISLEGIDCENVPPCEIYVDIFTLHVRQCGAPSAFRIRTSCTCGDSRIIFICAEHMRLIDSGQTGCGFCRQVRYATSVL